MRSSWSLLVAGLLALLAWSVALFYPQGYTTCSGCARVSRTWAGVEYIDLPLWLYTPWLVLIGLLLLGAAILVVRSVVAFFRSRG